MVNPDLTPLGLSFMSESTRNDRDMIFFTSTLNYVKLSACQVNHKSSLIEWHSLVYIHWVVMFSQVSVFFYFHDLFLNKFLASTFQFKVLFSINYIKGMFIEFYTLM